jgi:hypothetical protein
MERPLEGDAKLEQDIINSMPVLENEETWSQRVIDEDDEIEDSDAKRQWKLQHPNDTIKRQRALYEKGLISHLPWETIEKLDQEKYEQDDGPLTDEQLDQIQKNVSESYVQNEEQTKDSIWQQIKKNQS